MQGRVAHFDTTSLALMQRKGRYHQLLYQRLGLVNDTRKSTQIAGLRILEILEKMEFIANIKYLINMSYQLQHIYVFFFSCSGQMQARRLLGATVQTEVSIVTRRTQEHTLAYGSQPTKKTRATSMK